MKNGYFSDKTVLETIVVGFIEAIILSNLADYTFGEIIGLLILLFAVVRVKNLANTSATKIPPSYIT